MSETGAGARPGGAGGSRLGRIYALIVEDDEARVCKDIPDSACRVVPHNFMTIVASSALTKLGDALASPKTVLAWLLGFVGAPVVYTGLLVPIRESGSMLPQLLLGDLVRRLSVRKWVWVAGSVVQCGAVAAMGIAAWLLSGGVAGAAVVGALVVFSLARAFCSIASKDVMGKTVPKTRRGRLQGLATATSGALTVAFGLYMLLREGEATPGFYAALLLGAGGLWLAAALLFATVREEPGATGGGVSGFSAAFGRLGLLRSDAAFRRFVITRALLLCSALSAPYYVTLAQEHAGASARSLGLFVLASGLAASLSSTFWGAWADASSRRVLIAAAALAASIGVVVFAVDAYVPALAGTGWFYPAAFLVLSVAHSGTRLGRKTYLVDMAGGNKRTDYVAVANTVIGLVLLLASLVGLLSAVLGPRGIILVLSLFGFAGALLGRRLPEVQG